MPTLSESRSRLLVSEAGIPVSNWETTDSTQEAVSLARNLGFPVVVKVCGDEIKIDLILNCQNTKNKRQKNKNL